ncbi:LysR family transcriptional regulator [Pseudonocardia kongjuensis]|uniref:LysR family transcriptional regulator n=1 Tax=Pseudonocardia kongjuensis TaxID=102227 RepID=UPI0031DAAAB0
MDNHISLQKLEVLCAVVEAGGVGRAAESLYVSQPVVSEHLRSLESRIGAKLFYRQGRSLHLTEAGRAVHLWAGEVLRGRTELDTLLRNLSTGSTGTVSIGASQAVGNTVLPGTLIRFRRANPSIAVTMDVCTIEAALAGALSGINDFCLVTTPTPPDTGVFSAELVAEPPFALVAAAGDDTVPDRLAPEALADLPYVCPPARLAARRSQDLALASVGVHGRRVEIELGSTESVKQAVAAGLGVALTWRHSVAPEIAAGTLREITVPGTDLRDRLYLVHRVGKRFTPPQERLLREIRDAVHEMFTARRAGADPRPAQLA